MKNIVLALFIVLTMKTSGAASDYDDVSDAIGDSGYSQMVHFTVGALVGGITLAVIPDSWELNPWIESAISVGVSLAVGGLIESLDEEFDKRDFWDYGGGGFLSVTIIKICF